MQTQLLPGVKRRRGLGILVIIKVKVEGRSCACVEREGAKIPELECTIDLG